MKKAQKVTLFVIAIILISITKQLLVNKLPIMAYAYAKQDDALMVNMANSILEGNWLGNYDENTLTKGVMFPLFLCMGNLLGMNYISFQTLFYTISCLIFIYGIKDFIKSKKFLLIIFFILVFNPVSFSTDTLSRVYRNGITMSQVLIIFGSYIGLYMNRTNKEKAIKHSLLAGFGFSTLYHTREDAFWIMPFIFTVTCILIGLLIKETKEDILKKNKFLLFIYILPFLMLFIVTELISTLNYKYYGIHTYNELNKSEFTKCMKTMYSIKPEKEIYRVSFTDEKINKMCENSETLNKIKNTLISVKHDYSSFGNRTDGETEDGWFFWVLREAAAKHGYYETASKANEFYKQVTEELNTAIKEGKFETQPVMPSSLMPPWRTGKALKILENVLKEFKFVSSFENARTLAEESTVSNNYYTLELFKKVTRNDVILPSKEIRISGWYANLKEENVDLEIQNDSGETIYKFASLEYREDVQKYLENNLNIKRDGKSAFNVVFNSKDEEIFLVAKKDNEILTKEKIDKERYVANENYILSLDEPINIEKDVKEVASKQCEKLNFITNIYKNIGFVILIIALISYVIFIIKMIVDFKKKHFEYVNIVLILSGIFLSMIVLFIGVAYNEISSCDSITYMYLSGAYPLNIMFCSIAILKLIEEIFNNKRIKGRLKK